MSLENELARIADDLEKRRQEIQRQIDESTANGSTEEILERIYRLKRRIEGTPKLQGPPPPVR